MQVEPELLNIIDSFRDRYTVILITGNMDSFTRFTVPSLELEQYFDVISNSYYEGRHKTDDNGALFIKYTTKFAVNIADCLLFDDSDKVLDVFSLLGGDARKVMDAQDTLQQLVTLGKSI
jgi:FMN phosphatase YigB (HAD superfamily)